MNEQNQRDSIMSMARGAFEERVDYEMDKVIQNILDPNTKATAKRKITLTIELTPDDERRTIGVSVTAKSTLAATNPVATALYVTSDGNGELVVAEMVPQVPGQLNMDGTQQEAPLAVNEVSFPQQAYFSRGDGQFLLRLPKDAVCRGLSRVHLPAGKAGLSALTDTGRPDLKQQVQPIRTLHQGTQNSIFVPGFQQRGNMIAVKPAQICQFFSHSSIVKAR